MKKILFFITLISTASLIFVNLYAWSVWETAGRITWTPGKSYYPELAIDSNDNLYLVWQDDSPGHFEIYFKRSTDGGTSWTGAQRLTWSSGGFETPDIAFDSTDAIYVVMRVPYGKICYKKSTDSGVSWSSPQTIAWKGGSMPAIAIDINDTIHVAWPDGGGGGQDWITYKKSTDYGATWSLPKRIFRHTYGTDVTQDVSLHVANNNTLHVVFGYGTEGVNYWYKNSTDDGDTWPAAKRITWTNGNCEGGHAFASDSNSAIHFTYNLPHISGDHRAFYKNSTDEGTTWSVTKRLTWTGSSFASDLDIDSNDNIHVFFMHKASTLDYWEVYYKKSTDSGITWAPIQRITWRHPGETHDCNFIRAAIDNNDDIHVVWWRDGDFYYGKMKKRY